MTALRAALLAVLLFALGANASAAAELQPVGNFEQPISITSDPEDPGRLFIAEREGEVVEADGGNTQLFADLKALVTCCDGERGLLSIALAPDFPESGRFYAAYTGETAAGGPLGDLHVDAFRRVEGTLVREPIISVEHETYANHNGGQIHFGPDGNLFISVGDGGSGGDPFDAGQDLEALLGKVLRIDPRPGETPSYVIPAGNPFAGIAGSDEIWAYGLRNPWRFSFDRATGDLFVADVGQGAREEVDVAHSPAPGAVGGAGANYGWDCREGLLAYMGPPGSPSEVCDEAAGFVDPAFDYPHTDPGGGGAFGCSITGGYVVRDQSLDGLVGRYLYADFCQGRIRSFIPPATDGGAATGDRSEGLSVANPVSFGEDSCGRVYVASNGGAVYRLVGDEAAECGGEPGPEPEPEPEPQPEPEPEPEPSPGPQPEQPLTIPAIAPSIVVPTEESLARPPRISVRLLRRGRDRVEIRVRVAPCGGNAGRRVLLNRGGKRLAARRLDRGCRAMFRAHVAGRSTFRAVLPAGPSSGFVRSRRLAVRAAPGR